ncbi:hypothetical protein ACFQ1E_20235 [Sphingomonas canadensis]|uniref:Secreted protein n=1 Tax=Sphingomonas canadensis TaxID=1219257 RepID=A0ABW3HB10_9SPHN|nr:hypothetical protein [Sphingomonas canadensis]MCW3838413.1 hypothetical protein [Sphingomonas canadensis]
MQGKMTRFGRSGWARGMMAAACLTGASAAEAQSIYTGNCDRARALQREQTVEKLMPGTKYKGVVSWRARTDTSCNPQYLVVYSLTRSSSTGTSKVYSVRRDEYRVGLPGTSCPTIKLHNSEVYGTVTFTTKVTPNNGLCDFTLNSDWALRNNSGWSTNWSVAVQTASGTDRVVNQSTASGYVTPIALTIDPF